MANDHRVDTISLPNVLFSALVVQQTALRKSALARVLGRTVIDKTGLTGAYQVHLEWTPDMVSAADAAGNATAVDAAGVSIFTAVREQLGLELKPAKGPVEVLVVDGVERPSEN